MTSGDTSRAGGLVWGSAVQLPMDITFKGITCTYNNLIN
jgi:hypothetical protein